MRGGGREGRRRWNGRAVIVEMRVDLNQFEVLLELLFSYGTLMSVCWWSVELSVGQSVIIS